MTFISELLEPSNELSWDLLDLVHQKADIPEDVVFDGLLTLPAPINRTVFRFKRSGLAGDVDGYKEEVRIGDVDNANSANSLSVNRKYTSKAESIKGRTSFLPFQPGGLVLSGRAETSLLHKNEQGLYDIPQGLSRGLALESEGDATELPSADGVSGSTETEIESYHVGKENQKEEVAPTATPYDVSEIDNIVSVDYGQMQSSLTKQQSAKRHWAHVVDVNHTIENFDELVPNMAREWPFELDTFQKEAVYHLEQGDSVFVAAHTSAGKTVVAEYAIAMATRNMTKAIYTSPIKALSNQKFRDFKETFKDIDVGLITGDVQINPEANCLIMTTEILRSMLYRGADLIRDVEFVIFDEVHYVNDAERGVVWEEVIIMLPDHVKYILLSATVPNTFEFANWVGRTKHKDIYVISTQKRPVPLEIFICAKDQTFKVVDSQRNFLEANFKQHRELLEGPPKGAPKATMGSGSRGGPGGTARGGNRGGRGGGGRGGGGGGRGGGGGAGGGRGGGAGGGGGGAGRGNSGSARRFDGPHKNTWTSLVQDLKKKELLPAVVFVFSKKKCEEYAGTLKGIDFCTAREKSEIHNFVDRAVARLKKEDRELPQILTVRDMLSRGIAVHHGGLLPIVKECIEILFAKTLVKVLFATETFAMGLNLPTRTVVFSSTRKNDGKGFRNLLPGEFTQMSGRAGRRGLDKTGTVILMAYNQALPMADFKEVTLGKSTKLSSQFRLTYNMILNLLRIEAMRVEEMIKHSFSENSAQVLIPENKKRLDALVADLARIQVPAPTDYSEEEMLEAFGQIQEYEQIYVRMVEYQLLDPSLRNAALKVGRMLYFRSKNGGIRLGFVVKKAPPEAIMVLTFSHGKAFEESCGVLPYLPLSSYLRAHFRRASYAGNLHVESVPYTNVHFLCRYSLKASIRDIVNGNKGTINEAEAQIRTILRRMHNWDSITFDNSLELTFYELNMRMQSLLDSLADSSVVTNPQFAAQYTVLRNKAAIEAQIDALNHTMSDENLELLPAYNQRLAVLEELGFIDHNHNVVLKGRVACEINSGWELVLTELVLDNFLGDFDAPEIVALLSCFVYEGRNSDPEPPCVTPRLERGKARIRELTKKMLVVYTDKQVALTSDEEEFLERNRFALVNVVYEWARGLSFNDIMTITGEAEGTIVRVITRLDEVCREVKSAALIVGDSSLHAKMSEAQEKIKRDIVFCASLYL